MRTAPFLFSLLLATGIRSAVLAQTSQDTLSQRIHRQDSLETVRLARINAVTLTDSTTRAALNSALNSAAAATTPPKVDTTRIVYPNAAGQRVIYDTNNIVNVLRYAQSDITVVCSHRGYFMENGVPENSLRAIQRADDNDQEMVELDIKMSSDGVPVLSHDFTVGRATVGGNYNLISNYASGQLQKFLLRDKNGNQTSDHLPTLEQALDYIHDHRIAIVVTLDIKARDAARACWEIVKRKKNAWDNPAYNWVIFKINATVYGSAADVAYDLPGMMIHTGTSGWQPDFYYDKLLYIPVYATNMIDKLDCINSQRDFKQQPFCVAFEINYKQPGGILSDQMEDIYSDIKLHKRRRTKAIFNAIPDAGGNRFWSSNGHDQYTLASIYYTAKDGRRKDTDDRRGSWSFLSAENFNMIITDDPVGLASDQRSRGRRDISWYRPHPDGTADEVDPHTAGTAGDSTASRTAAIVPGTSATTGSGRVNSTLGVYPNPTLGNLTVNLNQATAGTVQFRITDQTGRTVLTQERKLPAGAQQVVLPNLRANGAKPGLYLLQVIRGNGQPRQTTKVQVN